MKKLFKFGIIPLLLLFAFVSVSEATHSSRRNTEGKSSMIILEKNPGNKVKFPEIAAPSGNPNTNHGWLYVKDDSGTSALYFEADDGTVVQLDAAGTAWDDISAPDANTSVDMTTFTTAWDFGGTADMMTWEFTGAFADVSGFVLEQKTGNPTNGTLLELKMADTDPDFVSMSISATEKVNIDADGVLTLSPSGSPTNTLVFSPSAAATTAILCTDTDYTNCISMGDNGILGTTAFITFTDFTVSADGVMTLSPDGGPAAVINITPGAAATTGIDLSDTNLTNAMSIGTRAIAGTNFSVNTDGDITAVDAALSGNLSVTGTFQQDALSAATAATTITLDGTGTGGVTIGSISTGNITLGGAATEVLLASGTNLDIQGGDLTITDTANTDLMTLVNNTMTTADIFDITTGGTRTSGSIIKIVDSATTANGISITADAMTSGNMIIVDSNNGASFTGSYFEAFDGSAYDLKVELHGITTIAGSAGNDSLILDTGDIKVTAGDLFVDIGVISIDTTADEGNNISRNFAGAGSAAVLIVNDDHASSTSIALDVNQDGTGSSTGIRVVHDGDSPTLDMSADAARTGNVIAIAMANQLAEKALNITGAWTGASNEGLIHLNPTGDIVSGSAAILIDYDTGTPQGTGFGIEIDDDSADGGTLYAVVIDSANNEALNVAAGLSIFAEIATFTGGLDIDEDVDIDFNANDEEVDITTTATDYAANSGVVQIHGDSAGQSNASYLLRLVRQADGDAQDHFIQFVDNSTGAAGNGDVMFTVDSGGAMTVAGKAVFTGEIDVNGTIVGDGGAAMYGMLRQVTNDTDGKTVIANDATTIETNSGAVGGGIWNLPEASTAIGMCYTFVVMAAQNMDINPDNGDQILAATNAAGDAIRSSTVGDTISLCAADGTNWVATGVYPASTDWTDVD